MPAALMHLIMRSCPIAIERINGEILIDNQSESYVKVPGVSNILIFFPRLADAF